MEAFPAWQYTLVASHFRTVFPVKRTPWLINFTCYVSHSPTSSLKSAMSFLLFSYSLRYTSLRNTFIIINGRISFPGNFYWKLATTSIALCARENTSVAHTT